MDSLRFLAMAGGGFLVTIVVVYIIARAATLGIMRSIHQYKQRDPKPRSEPNG